MHSHHNISGSLENNWDNLSVEKIVWNWLHNRKPFPPHATQLEPLPQPILALESDKRKGRSKWKWKELLNPIGELTLFAPAYLSISRIQRGGGHIVSPWISWVWVGLGFQFFLEMTCCGMIYHIQKDSWSLEFMEFGILSGSIFCYFVWIISTWFGILSGSSQTKRRFIKNLNLFWAFLLFFSFFGFRNFDTAENPQQSQFWVDPKLH